MTASKIKAYYGPGGALVIDKCVNGITQLLGDDAASFYGGRYFVAESMGPTAAKVIAKALGFEISDVPFFEKSQGKGENKP